MKEDCVTLLSAYPVLLLDAMNIKYGRLTQRSDLERQFVVKSKFDFFITPDRPTPTTAPWGHILLYIGPSDVKSQEVRLRLAEEIVNADQSELTSIVKATSLRDGENTFRFRNSQQKPPISVLFEPAKCRWVKVCILLGRRSEPPSYPLLETLPKPRFLPFFSKPRRFWQSFLELGEGNTAGPETSSPDWDAL